MTIDQETHKRSAQDALPVQESESKKVKLNQSTDQGISNLQLRVLNVHKHVYQKDFAKFLASNQVHCLRSKKAPKCEFALITFENAEQKEAARSILEGMELRGKILRLTDVQHRSRDESARTPRVLDSSKSPSEHIADQVTPLWNMPYPEQVAQKQERFRKVLFNFRRKIFDFFPKKRHPKESPKEDAGKETITNDTGVSEQEKITDAPLDAEEPEKVDPLVRIEEEMCWIRGATKANSGLPCPLLDLVESPIRTHYRNKCEFTFGVNPDGERALGFLLGLFKEGITTVVRPDESLHVKPESMAILNLLEEHVRKSERPVYDRVKKEGFWRLVQVRNFDSGEAMVLVQCHPMNLSPEEVQAEKDALKTTFEANTTSVPVSSLLFQLYDGVFNGFKEETESEILIGNGYVHESLLDLKFRVSPTAFFQVNTPATVGLYSQVKNWCIEPMAREDEVKAGPDGKNVVLLDLCCGTGTIGLAMSSNVKKVIGVEMVKEAIEDAEHNARLNGITNVTYLHGKVEDVIQNVFKNHVSEDDQVVAILDPPRSGVHSTVIQAIRACSGLERVIYISCDADAALSNFIDLCRPSSKKYKCIPFRPVRAQGFDLFPQTKHAEFVVELSR